jgi:adenosylhomocysteine nucleosidase
VGKGALARPGRAKLSKRKLPDSTKIAIVAALEREIWPLVKHWQVASRTYDGREFKFFEKDKKVVICAGIGGEAGRRATEAVIHLDEPTLLVSVGFAGALNPELKVGNILVPSAVVDANDGSRFETGSGSGVVLSFPLIAGAAQKAKLAKAYGADAVDMEGAAVGRGAQTHGIPFMAVKSISDELGFELPPMQRFVDSSGQFRSLAFAAFVCVRPWLWNKTLRLYRNCAEASNSLCKWLEEHELQILQNTASQAHPIKGAERIPI